MSSYVNIEGLASCALYAEYVDTFDAGLDEMHDKVPMGDFAYDYSHCYKKVDLVAYTMSFYDWLDAIVEDAEVTLSMCRAD